MSSRSRVVRVQITAPASDLSTIDEAAQAAGESRSEYLRRAALARAQGDQGPLTRAQEKAVEEMIREAIGVSGRDA